MEKIYGNTDGLTNLHNENFLKSEYQKYLDSNPNANFMMLDFKKFKRINDTFGHDMGDKYLIVFAKILKSSFDDSLVIRLHGDEFCVLTKYDEKQIIKLIELCNKKIALIAETATIPEIFEFNCGIVKAERGIDNTKAKADYMMYHAKNNNMGYQFFDEEIWKTKTQEESFLTNVTDDLNNDTLTYYQRGIYSLQTGNTELEEISTRDSKGESIFNDTNYQILRNNSLLKKVDIYNLQSLLSKVSRVVDGEILINLDYKSLIDKKDFLDYLQISIDINKINPSNIVLSINTNGMPLEASDLVISTISSLRKLGFKICLDKYSSITTDNIWENSEIDYIKYDKDYWKASMHNPKIEALINMKAKLLYDYSGAKTIFTCIKDKTEYDYVTSIGKTNDSDILLSGNYISSEKKIKIK